MDLVDDDKDGSITMAETQDVINKELFGLRKHTAEEFHRGDDLRDEGELMAAWMHNPARDWTTDEVVQWATLLDLTSCVDGLIRHKISGKVRLRDGETGREKEGHTRLLTHTRIHTHMRLIFCSCALTCVSVRISHTWL